LYQPESPVPCRRHFNEQGWTSFGVLRTNPLAEKLPVASSPQEDKKLRKIDSRGWALSSNMAEMRSSERRIVHIHLRAQSLVRVITYRLSNATLVILSAGRCLLPDE
jgi:hypothetical protein